MQKVLGLKEKTPRWTACTGNANANFGMAVSYVYAQKHFNDRAREKVGRRSSIDDFFFRTYYGRVNFQALEMLLDIKAAFDEMVSELDWMDASTRARAHKKLQAMRPYVGIPEWINNVTKLEKYYKGVSCPQQLSHLFVRVRVKRTT